MRTVGEGILHGPFSLAVRTGDKFPSKGKKSRHAVEALQHTSWTFPGRAISPSIAALVGHTRRGPSGGGEWGVHPPYLAAPLTPSRYGQWGARSPSRLSGCSPTAIGPSERNGGDSTRSFATWHLTCFVRGKPGRAAAGRGDRTTPMPHPNPPKSKETKDNEAARLLQVPATIRLLLDAPKIP